MGFDPVDLITGRVNYTYTDIELPGPIPLQFTRTWDSDSAVEGPLGHGVHLCYNRWVQAWPKEDCLSLMMADGRLVAFPLLAVGEVTVLSYLAGKSDVTPQTERSFFTGRL